MTLSLKHASTSSKPASSDSSLIDGPKWNAEHTLTAALSKVLGTNASSTTVTELSASDILDLIGSTQGQILYRGASAWAVLAPGTSGFVLTTGGAGANPSWAVGGVVDAEYIVGASNSTLTAERVVTNTSTVTWDLATASQAKANVVTSALSAADLLTLIKTVDGAGSGLDADLLDGSSSVAFGLVASPLSQFAATTSAQLASTISDEVGSGSALFGDQAVSTISNPQFATVELGHASDTTIARASAGNITVEGNTIYRAGGTDVALADGGTGATLADPNADRIMFWDDSAGAVTWLTAGTGLTITDTTITASGGAAVDRQTFNGSGTWTKPGSGTVAIIECWGGGGSGGHGSSANRGGGGGGGGAYTYLVIALASLGATETVTIGAGGAAQTVGDTAGNVGGTTTFGAWLSAFGGAGGGGAAASAAGGGGGGAFSAGTVGGADGGAGGGPGGGAGGTGSAAGGDSALGGGGGGDFAASTGVGGKSYWGGAGGGGGTTTNPGSAGGDSIFGGAGGGGGATSVAGGAGGTSKAGGNGGAGNIDTNAATAGTQPGGGGGGSEAANSGAGGNGRVVVTAW